MARTLTTQDDGRSVHDAAVERGHDGIAAAITVEVRTNSAALTNTVVWSSALAVVTLCYTFSSADRESAAMGASRGLDHRLY